MQSRAGNLTEELTIFLMHDAREERKMEVDGHNSSAHPAASTRIMHEHIFTYIIQKKFSRTAATTASWHYFSTFFGFCFELIAKRVVYFGKFEGISFQAVTYFA